MMEIQKKGIGVLFRKLGGVNGRKVLRVSMMRGGRLAWTLKGTRE